MKKIRLLIIGILLASLSGCFPVFVPVHDDHEGHRHHHHDGYRGRDYGERGW